ncbi:MAG: hypothetical protein H8E73_08565, partial [Planctomycetes bacterium]|nr:hypothetical protein [Planctomycetota bacterium]
MRKAKRTILTAILICVVTVPVCSAGTARSKGKLKHPTALELLDKYAETQNKVQSFIAETVSLGEFVSSNPEYKGEKRYYRILSEIRSDGEREYALSYTWNNISSPGEVKSKHEALSLSNLWDGKLSFSYVRDTRSDRGEVIINRSAKKPPHRRRYAAMGYLCGDDIRVDFILRKADTISVRDKTEQISGSECYVIDAEANRGKYTLWIDPKHGYNLAKAEVLRQEGDLYRGQPIPTKGTLSSFLENVRFEKVDGVWVPMEWDNKLTWNWPDYNLKSVHDKRTAITLNPDHEALGSFVQDDIKNGARVYLAPVILIQYTWQDGKVVDKEGNVVLDCMPKKPSDSAESKPKSPMKKRPSIWELVRKYAVQRPAAANPLLAERVVHFPKDKSIGRCFLVEPQPEQECLWNRILVWPKTDVGHVRGDVNVPAGKMLRLDVWDAGPRAHNALARLGPDDVQILNFYQCKKADDRMLSAASGLTGLKVLFLGQGRFTLKGLKHLTAFRELRALQLSVDVPVELLELIRNLTSLRYLNIGGPELIDAKMAKVGQLPWLTQLSIAAHDRSEGLRHIAKLKSLRYLWLAVARSPQLDRHLAYIADLTELEEINLEDSIIGDAGLQHLKGMIKLKKLDIGNRDYPVSYKITDAGMVHLSNVKSLEELKLPYAGVTDIGLAQLAGLNALKKLNVGRDVTDEGMVALAKMKSLEDLDLGCPNITDAGLAELCRSSSLKSLSIGRCKVTDAGLANVANLKSLEHLSVSNVPINGAGLGALKQCPSLRGISLSSVELQSNAITHVAAIPSLEKLRLYYIGTPITDESLNQLSTLTNLKTLGIVIKETSQMPITDAGIAHLSRLKNLEHVSLNHCEKITEKGLKHFEGLASLRYLRLNKSRVTKAGVDRLKAAIPDISVTVPATMRSAVQRPPSSSRRLTTRTNST